MTNANTEVEFVDALPPVGGTRSNAAAFAAACRENPGRWAVYLTSKAKGQDGGVRQYLKQKYGLEVASRTVDGVTKVYARWNGGAA